MQFLSTYHHPETNSTMDTYITGQFFVVFHELFIFLVDCQHLADTICCCLRLTKRRKTEEGKSVKKKKGINQSLLLRFLLHTCRSSLLPLALATCLHFETSVLTSLISIWPSIIIFPFSDEHIPSEILSSTDPTLCVVRQPHFYAFSETAPTRGPCCLLPTRGTLAASLQRQEVSVTTSTPLTSHSEL